jgi:hypothetical protein
MNEQLQALEAAKLAALVGGQLKQVDSLTTERQSMPANKINMQNFVAKVRNPHARVSGFIPETPHGFAPPVPEDVVQQMVPDISVNSSLPPTRNEPIEIPQQIQYQPNLRVENSTNPVILKNQSFNQDSKTLKKINSSLKSIKVVLDEILLILKQK